MVKNIACNPRNLEKRSFSINITSKKKVPVPVAKHGYTSNDNSLQNKTNYLTR